MNGYLERLVSRHLEPPAVRPRAVSRFEGDLVGGTVETESAPPDGPQAAAFTPVAAVTPVGQANDVSAARSTESRIGRTGDWPAPRPADARRSADAPASAAPWPAPVATPARRTDGPPRPDDEAGRGPAREVPMVAPVAIRRAEPSEIAGAIAASTPPRRSLAVAPSEPDVVHVHIGRVEVRAIVPPKETPRPAPRQTRPAPLSLERYLAGERRS